MPLLDDVRNEASRRGFSPSTASAYAGWVRRFVLFHDKTHPEDLGADEVRAFLVALAVERGSSSSTRNQALSALKFLYREVIREVPEGLEELARARRDIVLPIVLSREEVSRVIGQVPAGRQLPVRLLYGSGMRLSECLGLRLKDLDVGRGRIHVRAGKGKKDRTTVMPASLQAALQGQVKAVLALHEQDVARGAGFVELPGSLRDKAPYKARDPAWQWVFPATRRYTHAETGERRRHHLHPTVLQRVVRRAVERAGILKAATCHTFRHSFATHLVEDGVDMRTIQSLLGHADLRTTMIYTHVAEDRFASVRSPVDMLTELPPIPMPSEKALLDKP